MTEDNTTETVESGETESAEDSPVITALRKELREAQRELKAIPSRADIEAEVRASLARSSAIEAELVGLKLPKGLAETVEGKLGGAEVNRDAVVKALSAIGFEFSESNEGGEAEGGSEQVVEDLSEVANLGSQVANAATQQHNDNLTDKINAAETPDELARVMREAGLGQ